MRVVGVGIAGRGLDVKGVLSKCLKLSVKEESPGLGVRKTWAYILPQTFPSSIAKGKSLTSYCASVSSSVK